MLANERKVLSAKVAKSGLDQPHPLISKFIEDGPLNPMFHNRWNPRTGKVDPLPLIKPIKKKKKKKKVIVEASDDEDSSVRGSIETDPFDFLTKKTSLAAVVDMALLQSTPLIDGVDNGDLAIAVEGDNMSDVSVEGESLRSKLDEDDMNARAEKEATLKQNVFNQLWAMIDEIDSIRNPKPYRQEGWSRAEKKAYRVAEQDRKLQLINTCEAIA